jgi:hypothetical protein
VDALQVREAAAIDLVKQDLLDSDLALAHVVWPTDKVLVASDACADRGGHRGWTDAHREEARRLHAEGLSWSQIAERVCGDKRFKSTVQGWL